MHLGRSVQSKKKATGPAKRANERDVVKKKPSSKKKATGPAKSANMKEFVARKKKVSS